MAAITASTPSSTHHTAVDTGSAVLRSVSALTTIASAPQTADEQQHDAGPERVPRVEVADRGSYQGTNSDTITSSAAGEREQLAEAQSPRSRRPAARAQMTSPSTSASSASSSAW